MKRKCIASTLALLLGIASIYAGTTVPLHSAPDISTVQAAPYITVEHESNKVAVGKTLTLTAGIDDGSNATFTWTSKDESIATVVANGDGKTATLTGLKAGGVYINVTAEINGAGNPSPLSTYFTVTDGEPQEDAVISIDNISLDHSIIEKGGTATLTVDVSITPDSTPDVHITAVDTDKIAIADLSDLTTNGSAGKYRITKTIKGIGLGTATIEVYATSANGGAAKDGIKIEVIEGYDGLSGYVTLPKEVILNVGETKTITETIKINGSNGTQKFNENDFTVSLDDSHVLPTCSYTLDNVKFDNDTNTFTVSIQIVGMHKSYHNVLPEPKITYKGNDVRIIPDDSYSGGIIVKNDTTGKTATKQTKIVLNKSYNATLQWSNTKDVEYSYSYTPNETGKYVFQVWEPHTNDNGQTLEEDYYAFLMDGTKEIDLCLDIDEDDIIDNPVNDGADGCITGYVVTLNSGTTYNFIIGNDSFVGTAQYKASLIKGSALNTDIFTQNAITIKGAEDQLSSADTNKLTTTNSTNYGTVNVGTVETSDVPTMDVAIEKSLTESIITNVIDAISDDSEIAAWESTGTPKYFYVKAETATPSNNEQNTIAEKMSANETVGIYLDLNFIAQVQGFDGHRVTEAGSGISVTVNAPSGLPAVASGRTRQYSIIRMHNETAEKLVTTTNPSIRFTTDKFSIYALTYEDVAVASTTSRSSASSTSSSRSSSSSGSSGGGGGNSSSSSNSKVRSTGSSKAYYSKIGKASMQYDSSALSYKAKTAKVPATIKVNKKTYKVTAIAANAFADYSNLTSVTIGKNVKRIDKDAFSGCKKLKSITINSKKLTAKKIKGAFNDSAITTVYVPADKVDAYKKIFTKKNVGKKVAVKAIK